MTPCPVVSLLGEYPMLLFHGPHLSMIANRRGLSHVLTKLFVWLQLILPVINRTTRFKEPLTFCGFLMSSVQVNSLLLVKSLGSPPDTKESPDRKESWNALCAQGVDIVLTDHPRDF